MPLDRPRAVDQLKSQDFDLIVIGGGATGAGVALDAVTRGLRVALLERDDFASGTSSRSTKLIHGGVRYLELAVKQMNRGQYKLVREALHERATLLRIAPHLVRPIALVTPVYGVLEGPYYRMGLKLYDWIAGKSGLQRSHFLRIDEALKIFPMLRREGLRGGVVYYDGQFNDARMNVTLALTAAERGACVANHVAVTGFVKEPAAKDPKAPSKIRGVLVRDAETGDEWEVRARVVVNAAGPFCDELRVLDRPESTPLLKTSSGTHIVLDGRFGSRNMGLLIPKTEDGRVLFLLPWLGHTLVGTTDRPAPLEQNPQPEEQDIEYILRQLDLYFALKVTRKDILAAWTGLRPLVGDAETEAATAKLSRDHFVEVSPTGLVTITGGKWTTYRRMAADAVDFAIKEGHFPTRVRPRTDSLLLAGADGYRVDIPVKLEAAHGIPPDIAQHLSDAYGDRAFRVAELAAKHGFGARLVEGHPFLEAEVVHAVRDESARTPVDVLARRMRLAFLDRDAARAALPRVTRLMAQELRWDDARAARERDAATAYLGLR